MGSLKSIKLLWSVKTTRFNLHFTQMETTLNIHMLRQFIKTYADIWSHYLSWKEKQNVPMRCIKNNLQKFAQCNNFRRFLCGVATSELQLLKRTLFVAAALTRHCWQTQVQLVELVPLHWATSWLWVMWLGQSRCKRLSLVCRQAGCCDEGSIQSLLNLERKPCHRWQRKHHMAKATLRFWI